MYNFKQELDATMNFANPGYHIPEIEQNYSTVKERYRKKYHRFSFS